MFHHKRNTQDISLGGIRVFSDNDYPVGSRLDLDVVLPDGTLVRCWARVIWRVQLSADAPARFDVGLKFTDMEPSDVQRVASVLVRPTDLESTSTGP